MLFVSRAGGRMSRRIEMRLEEFLGHRGRDAVAPLPRQRLENHRRVQVALVVGGENDGAAGRVEVLQSFDP